MALKGDRVILETDITFACSTAQLRGGVLVETTSGSGVALGDSAGTCAMVANPSGFAVAGLLLEDVVQIDQTRYHRNFHKLEQVVGERVALLRKGRVTTDQVTGSPSFGMTAYLGTSGVLTPTVSATGGTAATPKVGQFRSTADENGFVTVDINLPAI